MADLERMQRDKATILAIIKYVLIAVLATGAVYYGFRLFWILLPFVFGFILARVSAGIVIALKNLQYGWRQRRRNRQQAKKAGESAGDALPPEGPDGQAAVPESEIPAETANPATRKKQGRYPQGLARSRQDKRLTMAVYVLLIIAFVGLFVGVIIAGISQLRALANYLPNLFRDTDLTRRLIDYVAGLSDRLGGILQANQLTFLENELANLQTRLLSSVPGLVAAILNWIGVFAANLPIVFFIIIVVIMSGYYFITDSRSLYIFMRRNITSKVFREKSIRLVNTLSTTLFRVIGGYVFLLLITFMMALAGLLIIKMPYAVIFAMIAAIVDFLPVLGLSATMIPIAIYMFVNGNIIGGIGALIVLAVMTLIRRVIEPAILGNAMSLHPMATLVSMIVGIALYGITGIIVGPIILVVAKEVLALFGIDEKLRNILGDILNKVSS